MGFGKWKVLTVEKREPDCGESEERKWRKPRCLSQELRRKRREVSLEARVCFRLIVLLQLCLTFQLMFYYHLIFYMCTFMGTIYKYKCTLVLNEVKVARSCPTLCNLLGILQARIVGSLSLLPEIFPTQESNQDLLHCSWILYQLSYQGS